MVRHSVRGMAKLILRTTLSAGALAFIGGLSLLLLSRWPLGFSAEQLRMQLLLIVWHAAAGVLATTVFAAFYLAPVFRESGANDELRWARRWSYPSALAGAVMLVLALVVGSKAIFDVTLLKLDGDLVAGLAGTALSLGLVGVLALQIAAKRWMRPVASSVSLANVPVGRLVSLRWTIVVTAVASGVVASVPADTMFRARMRAARDAGHALYQRYLAQMLVAGGRALSLDEFREVLAATRVPGGRLRVRRWPSATSARIRHRSAHDKYLQVVAPVPRLDAGPTAAWLIFVLVALAFYLGQDLAEGFVREVNRFVRRLRMLVAEREGQQLPATVMRQTPQLKELRLIADAINALLSRLSRINIDHFVAVERLLEADQTKTRFLASMSHDLRSPLNSILGFAELLLVGMQGDLNAGQRQALQSIEREGTHLLHLIDELLDAARVEARQMSIHREELAPVQIVSRAVKLMRERSVMDAIELETELQAGLPPMKLDGERLAEALMYLVRYLSSLEGDDKRATIRVRTTGAINADVGPSKDRADMLIEVHCPSVTVAEEQRPHLFTGFRREAGREGLGLDVPLAAAFVQLHHGSLRLETDQETGTRFIARIPLRQRRTTVVATVSPN